MSAQGGTLATAVAAPGSARPAGEDPSWRALPIPARLVLAGARARSTPDPDRVEFSAACPVCGRDCTWTEERDETRLRISLDCRCA